MMMHSLHRVAGRLLTATAVLAAMASPAAAQTLQLTDSSATTIRGGSYASTNYSSDTTVETRASSDASYVRRIVLKFDTHNTLPLGTAIASAHLTLTVAGGNDESRQLTAHRGGLSYNEWEATWKLRKGGTAWSAPGGEIGLLAATQTATNRVGSKVTFDVTATVRNIVNGVYSTNSRYARFLVADAGGSSRGSYKQFFSDEAADVSVRPTLVVTVGTSSVQVPSTTTPEPDSTSAPPSEPSTSTTTLKVLDWNIHHGVDVKGVYRVAAQADYIAKLGAHVVSLNEVERYTGWGSEDQPARFAALLKEKTGRTWYYQFAQIVGNTRGQGNLLLSIYPFESTADHLLSYSRSVAQATIIVNGRRVSLFSTHLDAESSSRRSTQMSQLTRWAESFPESRILTGDFNAWPGAGEISKMTAGHLDAWAEAKKTGDAIAYPGNTAGNTRNSRIDYVWLSKGATSLKITRAQVFEGRDANGVMLSDHRPLMATFEVR